MEPKSLYIVSLGRRSGSNFGKDLWMAEAAEADTIDEADGAIRVISWDELHLISPGLASGKLTELWKINGKSTRNGHFL